MAFALPRSLSRGSLVLRRSYGTVQATVPPAAGVAPSPLARLPSALQDATAATAPRTNWTREEIQQIYDSPLSQLTYASVRPAACILCVLKYTFYSVWIVV